MATKCVDGESTKIVRSVGYQYTDMRSRYLANVTTVYTDAGQRITFGTKDYGDGVAKYPTMVQIINRDATSDILYAIYNSERACSAYAARATILSSVISAATAGHSANSMIYVGVTVSGNNTTASVTIATGTSSTITITFYAATASAGTSTSTQEDFVTALNAFASDYVSAAEPATSATVCASVTATALIGGYDKDSQAARLAALAVAATKSAGYRLRVGPGNATEAFTIADAAGISDLIVAGSATITSVDVLAFYPAEY